MYQMSLRNNVPMFCKLQNYFVGCLWFFVCFLYGINTVCNQNIAHALIKAHTFFQGLITDSFHLDVIIF